MIFVVGHIAELICPSVQLNGQNIPFLMFPSKIYIILNAPNILKTVRVCIALELMR